MEKINGDALKQIPKKQFIKWIVFIGAIYALYDAVYLYADSRRLMLEYVDISSKLMPKVLMHIDVPLIIGVLVLCMLFAKQQSLSALALRNKTQVLWLALGAALFVGILYMKRPSGVVEGCEIVHVLVTVALLEELVFRGVLFKWMEKSGAGVVSYLASGLAWGALLGIRSMVVGDVSAIGAVLPMILMGVVVGTLAAIVYKKTDSLWFVTYLHAALCLL